MDFFRRAPVSTCHLAILPGTFNPPTVAHLALAQAALRIADQVAFVLPRLFPHKPYTGATFEQRVQLLLAATENERRFSIAATGAGLFIDIARECRAAYGDPVRLSFLCGRDAAERIVNWDYGPDTSIDAMLREFDLLVASRAGEYKIPVQFAASIQTLPLDARFDPVSATEVRTQLQAGLPWEQLVPREIVAQVREIYAQSQHFEIR